MINILLFTILLFSIEPTESTKGCHLLGCSTSGGCVFEYFVKTADNEYDSEDGEHQIWGYNPADIQRDKSGKPFYITIPENKFLKAGMVKHVEHSPCVCHCPSW